MRNLAKTTFGAVFQNEVLLNSRRIAPYALIILFSATAVMGWSKGPAVALGWATNSDFYIARSLKAFSFLFGLPIFNAIIMGDSVIKDFRLGIDPLIFSKPVSRAQYLFGKFLGSFFVLVCCSAAFPLTLLLLQAFRPSQMVVQQARVLPYFKHFFFFVVITHLMLAAFYFAVGALTRNSKIVYGLAISFYPIYITAMLFLLAGLPVRWRNFFDAFLLNSGPSNNGFGNSADFLNSYVMSYTPDMIGNRVLLLLIAAICLTVLYVRFRFTERPGSLEKSSSMFGLSTAGEGVYYPESSQSSPLDKFESLDYRVRAILRHLAVPEVLRVNEGIRANVNKLIAALGTEFRLLRAERSLVVIMPLAIFISILEVAFYNIPPDVSHSAAYATNTAKLLWLFLIGMTVFYTGEALHRDRELRIEPVLWTMPAPNNVLLLSKFLAVLSLAVSLIVLVGLAAILIQLFRGHTPVDISAYLIAYSVILLPSIVFTTGASIALNILLRDKYVVYALSTGTAAGLFYLYSQGYNHWLYNPVLYQLWTYADLTGGGSNQVTILLHRIYCLAIAGTCLSLAHLFFQRKSATRLFVNRHPSDRGLSFLIALVSLTIAFVSAVMIVK